MAGHPAAWRPLKEPGQSWFVAAASGIHRHQEWLPRSHTGAQVAPMCSRHPGLWRAFKMPGSSWLASTLQVIQWHQKLPPTHPPTTQESQKWARGAPSGSQTGPPVDPKCTRAPGTLESFQSAGSKLACLDPARHPMAPKVSSNAPTRPPENSKGGGPGTPNGCRAGPQVPPKCARAPGTFEPFQSAGSKLARLGPARHPMAPEMASNAPARPL